MTGNHHLLPWVMLEGSVSQAQKRQDAVNSGGFCRPVSSIVHGLRALLKVELLLSCVWRMRPLCTQRCSYTGKPCQLEGWAYTQQEQDSHTPAHPLALSFLRRMSPALCNSGILMPVSDTVLPPGVTYNVIHIPLRVAMNLQTLIPLESSSWCPFHF